LSEVAGAGFILARGLAGLDGVDDLLFLRKAAAIPNLVPNLITVNRYDKIAFTAADEFDGCVWESLLEFCL